MKSLAILGSTGSIGTQAIDVLVTHPEQFTVTSLAAGGASPQVLASQAAALGVRTVAVHRESAVDAVRAALSDAGAGSVEILAGPLAVAEVAGRGDDIVLNGITGSIGLAPTLAALRAGSTLALANKESLVVGGALVAAAKQRSDQIVPVDSEHSAIAQCLRGGRSSEVRRIILTASGGPFRGRSRAELASVTPAEALNHPTWSMGPVVTINSATLVNKALELIEAHLLFDVAPDDIVVVVHPQSVIHSMVEFQDGSTIAQASPPDMRLPIALGLSWPDRLADVTPPVDWTGAQDWHFEPLDDDAFPAVAIARHALAASPTHPAVFNAANEEAVAAFRAGTIRFTSIVEVVGGVLSDWKGSGRTPTLDDVLGAETWAREQAHQRIGSWQP